MPWATFVQRLCVIAEVLVHQLGDVRHGLFAVDQRPDKAAVFIQVDVGDLWLFQKLLGNAICYTFVFNFQGDDALFVRGPVDFRIADRDHIQVIGLLLLILHW